MLSKIICGQTKKIELIHRATETSLTENVCGDSVMRMFYGTPHGFFFTSRVLTRKGVSALYGAYNDSPLSRRKIRSFIEQFEISTEECLLNVDQYTSFNDFFARKLKPGARPICTGSGSVASPGDGRLLVFPKLDDDTLAFVKWAKLRLLDLFGGNKELEERYRNGACAVLRLCPSDYHRFHFPVAGVPSTTKVVPGRLHSVSPYALERGIPVYCLNKRTITELDSPEFSKVLLLEVGAMMVGSIVQTYHPGTAIQRGDEKGYFKFGGSTTILFFEKDTVRFDADLVNNSERGIETLVKMGEQIATHI